MWVSGCFVLLGFDSQLLLRVVFEYFVQTYHVSVFEFAEQLDFSIDDRMLKCVVLLS